MGVFGDGLGAGTDVELFVHAPHVGIDGRDTDIEALGDFLVKVTTGQEIQDFLFARGKALSFGRGDRSLPERLHDLARDVAGHGRPAIMHVLESREQFLARGLFEQISGGAGGERVVDVVGIFVNGQHNELRGRQERFELLDGINTAHAGQIDIH